MANLTGFLFAFVVVLSLWLPPIPAQAATATLTDVRLWLQLSSPSPYQQCFDLEVDARVNGSIVATATTNPLLPFCLNNTMIQPATLSFAPTTVNVNPGDVVEMTIMARYRILGNFGNYGSLAVWYNGWSPGANTDSLVHADLGAGPQTYHLEAASQLSNVGPFGPPQRNALYGMFKNAWYSLGTWGRIAP